MRRIRISRESREEIKKYRSSQINEGAEETSRNQETCQAEGKRRNQKKNQEKEGSKMKRKAKAIR